MKTPAIKIEEMIAFKINGYTYQQIGDIFGISRQRIHQLISPPKEIREYIYNKYEGICNHCGKEIITRWDIHHTGNKLEDYNDLNNLELLCISCHKKAHGKAKTAPRKICICPICGKYFIAIISNIKRNKQSFCSNQCLGKYIGNNYGFPVHKKIGRKAKI